MSEDDEQLRNQSTLKDRHTGSDEPRQRLENSETIDASESQEPLGGERASYTGPVLRAGEQVDHFKVMRLLGRGGMGEVYLARDTFLGRKVALKMLRHSRLVDEKSRTRFIREARTTAKFSHPHIVTVHAVGDHAGIPYVALEYLDGPDLGQRMLKRHPGQREAMRIMKAVSSAVAEAHRHGVLHRDLKPENVVIPPDGRLRVVDFGLATVVEGAPKSTRGGIQLLSDSGRVEGVARPSTHAGTPSYMAPEQWLAHEQSPSTDVWALGVMLYELLSGSLPYDEPDLKSLFATVIKGDAPARLDEHYGVSSELAELVNECFCREPDQRPTAEALEDALERALDESRPLQRREVNPFRGLEPFRRAQANLFFGREREIEWLVERAHRDALIVVAGPSGAGKSSLVAAGAVPRLVEQGQWHVLRMRPGSTPFRTLAHLLIRGPRESHESSEMVVPSAVDVKKDRVTELAQHLAETPGRLGLRLRKLASEHQANVLLYIDQLEELVTLSDDQTRATSFLLALCLAADDAHDPIRVVVTVRDDFLGRLATNPQVRDAFSHMLLLQKPGREALEETLTKPLEQVGYSYDDPQLPATMVDEVHNEPACLPLLQFTAQQLWEQRDRDKELLLRSAYEAMGGVEGALAQHADGVLDELNPQDTKVARQLLVRLVTPEYTRSVVLLEDALDGLGHRAAFVLDRLTSARLVTARKVRGSAEPKSTVELVHESLIGRWVTLRRWLDEDKEEHVVLAEAGQAAALWTKRGRREEGLWRGEALAEATRVLSRLDNVPQKTRDFIEAAVAVSQRRTRLIRTAIAATVIGLSVIATAFALQSRAATKQKQLAELRETQALVLGARTALLRKDMLEARGTLRHIAEASESIPLMARATWVGVKAQPLLWTVRLGGPYRSVVAVQPGGERIAVVKRNSAVHLVEHDTGQVRTLHGSHRYTAVAFVPGGQSFVTSTEEGFISEWKLGQDRPLRVEKIGKAYIESIAVRPDGKSLIIREKRGPVSLVTWGEKPTLAPVVTGLHENANFTLTPDGQSVWVSRDTQLERWQITPAKLVQTIKHADPPHMPRFAMSRDGKLLASARNDGAVQLYDATDGSPTKRLATSGGRVSWIGFDSTAKHIARQITGRGYELREIASGRTGFIPTTSLYTSLDWSDPSGRMYFGAGPALKAFDGRKLVRRAESVSGHDDILWASSFSHDSAWLATGGADKRVLIWDVMTGRIRAQQQSVGHKVTALAFAPQSRRLAIGGVNREIGIWDFRSDGLVRRYQPSKVVLELKFAPDGQTLFAGTNDEKAFAWTMDDEGPARPVANCTGWCMSFAVHPQEKTLAVLGATANAPLNQIDLRTGQIEKSFARNDGGGAHGLAYDPMGRYLAVAGVNMPVLRVDSSSGETRALQRFPCSSYDVSVRPDGKRIAVPCDNGKGYLLDADTGTYKTLQGHTEEVNEVIFSPNGKLVASVGDDGTVRVWTANSGIPFWQAPVLIGSPPRMYSHRGWQALAPEQSPELATRPKAAWASRVGPHTRAVSFSPDGTNVCVLNHDGQVSQWSSSAKGPIAAARFDDVVRVVSSAAGCAVQRRKLVELLTTSSRAQKLDLPDAPRHLSSSSKGLVALSGEFAIAFTPEGTERKRWNVSPAASSAHLLSATKSEGAVLYIAYPSGSLEGRDQLPLARKAAAAPVVFKRTPSSRITALQRGPAGTLAIGYEDGTLGLWEARSGNRLMHDRLHGPVRHILLDQGQLFGVTELGDERGWDLTALAMSRCELLRDIWKHVPVVWQNGVATPALPPAEHPCSP